MILHLVDAVREGFHKVLLCAVDTNVVVFAVEAAAKLDVQELRVAFGTTKIYRYVPVHEISASLVHENSQGLPMFFMPTPGVTLLHPSSQGGRRQDVTLGSHLKK